jgi:hypothetical protein
MKRRHLPWRPRADVGSKVDRAKELASFFIEHRHLYNLR